MWPLPLIHASLIERSKLHLELMKGPLTFFLKGPTAQSKQGIYQARAIGTSLLLSFVINELHFLSLFCWMLIKIRNWATLAKKTLQNWTLQPLCSWATVYWPTFYDYVLESSISFYEVCLAFSRFVILTRMTWFPSFDINAIPGFNNEMRATCTNAFSMMRM